MCRRSRRIGARLIIAACGVFGSSISLAAVTSGGDTTIGNASSNTYVGRNASGTLAINGGSVLSSADGYVGYASTGVGTVVISGTGSKWTTSYSLHIGASGAGAINISAGGQMQSSLDCDIGEGTGALGTAAIDGAGSSWNTNSNFYVGNFGSGTLIVTGGAKVNAPYAHLGNNPGASGSAVVSGIGSNWTSGQFDVGANGNGDLTVSDGGVVTATTISTSFNSLHGNGTISANGLIADADLVFDSTHGTTQAFSFGSGGTLALTVNGNGDLGAGHKASGSLRIADGTVVQSDNGYLGQFAGSTGSAMVTGNGSTWANNLSLYVGNDGSGTLTVEAGGQVTNQRDCYIGQYAGASGVATVSGNGSTWTNVEGLHVGGAGSGTLNVQAGGKVTSRNGALNGTVTVTGLGSAWANTGSLEIGFGQPGTLNIVAGGAVSCGIGSIAYSSNSSGSSVTVSGPNSNWMIGGTGYPGDLLVGHSGFGSLTVADGGHLSATDVTISQQSIFRLHVTSDNMVTLGSAANSGFLINSGTLALYAGASLPAGVYHPFFESAGRTLSFSGAGAITAEGGVWNGADKSFTVGAASALAPGQTASVSSGQRFVVTDSLSNQQLGANFGVITGSVSFSASPVNATSLTDLQALLPPGHQILDAWDVTTNVAGETLLSFDIGAGARDLSVWHFQSGSWSPFTPAFIVYDSNGFVSFNANSFSAYAVTAMAPEPTMSTFLTLSGIVLALRRTRRRS